RRLQGRCYNCDEEGHYAPDCPKPRREREEGYSPYMDVVEEEYKKIIKKGN
ncbi:hypothetical protein DD594_28700, partial [Enterobacter cloacae complex sp. 4DZ1-17B1]